MEGIKAAVDEFLSQNQEDFELIKEFEEKIVDLTEDSLQEIVQLLKDHQNVFFKDHASIISFIQIIERALVFNFQKLELILDIILNFPTELRSHDVTDYELLQIFDCFQVSINYLFAHNFFSIESITKFSYTNDLAFVKFLPEIEQYDSEYSKLRESKLNISRHSAQFQELYHIVKTDPNRHIINRTTYYHPSTLHKCIREDDIDTFQSLLSKNNYTVNYRIPFSYYERAQTIDLDLCLLQIAATYSSINIFKFLWMQNDIEVPDNLLQYAFFGRNNEIIHICENKLSHDKVILQAIFMNRLDLLDYYLENFADKHIEKLSFVTEKLNEFRKSEENEDLYDLLIFEDLAAALNYLSVPLLQSCLSKIVFIFKNVDCSNNLPSDRNFLIQSSLIHFKLFQFLYSQKVDNFIDSDCFLDCIRNSITLDANDAFKLLFSENYLFLHIHKILFYCINNNLELANYILDFLIDYQSKEGDFSNLNFELDTFVLIDTVSFCYNEDVITKLIKVTNFFDEKNDLSDDIIDEFIDELIKVASSRMMKSLFDKIIMILPKNVLLKIADVVELKNHSSFANHIKSKLETN